jgi:UDP-N-acetylmuramoyl-tripeptide--D-alanyl-D-alanine ligase
MIELYLSEVAPALNATLLGDDVKFTGCNTDTRQITPGSIYVALRGENFDGHKFVSAAQENGASAVIVEQAVADCNLPCLCVADTRKALGSLAKFWLERFKLPLVAITGSNGKTTTKEMLRAIFAENVLANQGNFNNDIGVPLTLFNLNAKHQQAVIEMGANHAGEIGYLTQLAPPNVATITQCAPAHLEGFKTIKGVALAKGEIFSNLQADGIAVINNDDDYAELWRDLAAPHTISTFAINNHADVMATQIQLNVASSDFNLKTPTGDITIHLPLPGQHNIMNALAASGCALASGCSLNTIKNGLETMQSVTGRLQLCKGINDSTIINDTYNANPTSLNAALMVLQKSNAPRFLVLGDMNELGSQSVEFHKQAGKQAREFGVESLLAIGELSKNAVDSFGEGAKHFEQHTDLIKYLQKIATNATILVKGSRGMKMETIVNALQEEI